MKTFKVILFVLIAILAVTINTYAYEPEPVTAPGFSGTTPKTERGSLCFLSEDSVALEKSRSIYQSIISQEPDLFLLSDTGLMKLSGWKDMTESELEYLRNLKDRIIKDCNTTDKKIYEIVKYVAQNTCYDNDYYYYGRKDYEEVNHNAYDVLTNNSAVCLGYACATNTLLQLSGIPCVNIYSPDHVWNMAYNGKRWILLDSTWMSCGYLEDGELHKSRFLNDEWYDFSLETAHDNPWHLIEDGSFALYQNTILSFPAHTLKTSYKIPENVTAINDYAFFDCENAELIFNNTLEDIGYAALYQCYKISGNIRLKNAKVGDYAFSYISNTSDISVEGNASSLGEAAFYNCRNMDFSLKSLPETIKMAAFYNCTGLKGILDLSEVRLLGDYVFCGCSSVTDLIIGEKLNRIPERTFMNCYSLTDIIIEKGIYKIEIYAFANCFAIQNVYFKGTEGEYRRIDTDSSNYYFLRANTECNYYPYLTVSKSGNRFTARFKGICENETAVFAEYRNNTLVATKILPVSKTMTYTLTDKNSDEVAVFVFESGTKSIIPTAKAGRTEF